MLIQTPKIPHFLQRIQMTLDPIAYMEGNAKLNPDIFEGKVAGLGGSLVFLYHPKLIRDVLTSDPQKISAPGEFNNFFRPFSGSHSILNIEGDYHKKRRKLLMPAFHEKSILSSGKSIVKLTDKVFKGLLINHSFSALQAMQQITLEVILELVFDVQKGELYEELKVFFELIEDLLKSPLSSSILFLPFLQKYLGPWSSWSLFLRQRQKIDQLLYTEISQRRLRDNENRKGIIDLLISARDEEGYALSDQEVRDELIFLIIAGYETTYTTLTWALYWIYRTPQVKKRILAELQSLGNIADPLTISHLPYLTAVCHETLRINPPFSFTAPRLVQQPMESLGYQLEQGKVVVGCIYLLHHREDLYPNPKEFQPERFLNSQISPYEFIPFGMGLRRCVGKALAMLEIKLVLSTILSNYELALVDQKPEKPQRRGITIAPSSGVQMKLM